MITVVRLVIRYSASLPPLTMTSSRCAPAPLTPPPPRKKTCAGAASCSETSADERRTCRTRFRWQSTIIWSSESCSEQDPIRHVPKELEMASLLRCPPGEGGGYTDGLLLPTNKAHFRQTDYGVYHNLHIMHFSPVFISCIIRYNPI